MTLNVDLSGAAIESGCGPWIKAILINVPGFLFGFLIGGFTGYFGNWLWYRFGPHRSKPYFSLSAQGGTITFAGRMDDSNRPEIVRSLRNAPLCSTGIGTISPDRAQKTKTTTAIAHAAVSKKTGPVDL
jgi:hypothetical protein